MDVPTFITKLVEALAWPGVVVAILLIVRKELPAIARSLRKLKFKDVELEFGEAAKAVAAETNAAVPPPKPNATLLGESEELVATRLEAIGELSPRAAILEAWLRVEAAAANLISRQGTVSLSATPGPLRLRDELQRAGVLTPPQVSAFDSLRRLRNEAVHAPEAEFTSAAVKNYIGAALAMAAYLEDMAQ